MAEWRHIVEKGLMDEHDKLPKDDVVIDADEGDAVQQPKGAPAPQHPIPAEVARHNLTHLPYRSWCPHCVACRRPNSAHKSTKSDGRRVPFFEAD